MGRSGIPSILTVFFNSSSTCLGLLDARPVPHDEFAIAGGVHNRDASEALEALSRFPLPRRGGRCMMGMEVEEEGGRGTVRIISIWGQCHIS